MAKLKMNPTILEHIADDLREARRLDYKTDSLFVAHDRIDRLASAVDALFYQLTHAEVEQ